jgi:hypothetical protein
MKHQFGGIEMGKMETNKMETENQFGSKKYVFDNKKRIRNTENTGTRIWTVSGPYLGRIWAVS